MRTAAKRRAIRNALYRLGLHTTPKAIAHALREQGVLVDEGLVRQVRFEMLKEAAGGKAGKVAGRATFPAGIAVTILTTRCFAASSASCGTPDAIRFNLGVSRALARPFTLGTSVPIFS
jgi:hypothetical protein